jgi:cell division protein FtsB
VRKNGFKVALILVCIIWAAVGIASVWGKGGLKDIKLARQKAQEILIDVNALKKENEDLKLEISGLETSPSLYEIPAREKLLLKKPGEIVIYLPPNQKDTTPPSKNR